MGFVSRDLTVKLFAGGNCTPTPNPDCTPTPPDPGCTPTPPDPDCTPTPDCQPTVCQSCTNTPDCTPTICQSCTNTPPDCTPTPGGGERRTRSLGALRQQLRETLAQSP